MKRLLASTLLGVTLFSVPSFANVHFVSRTAKAGYKMGKVPVKAAYKFVKFAAKQVF